MSAKLYYKADTNGIIAEEILIAEEGDIYKNAATLLDFAKQYNFEDRKEIFAYCR